MALASNTTFRASVPIHPLPYHNALYRNTLSSCLRLFTMLRDV